jgi:hypothetical protein
VKIFLEECLSRAMNISVGNKKWKMIVYCPDVIRGNPGMRISRGIFAYTVISPGISGIIIMRN